MTSITNSKNNLPAVSKAVPPVGTLDYYVYVRTFKPMAEVFSPSGDMKKFDSDLTRLLEKTVVEVGQTKAQLSPTQFTKFLNDLRVEIFNYFASKTFEELKLCFHNGVREKYGSFNTLCIAVIHKWFDGFNNDEDRALALKAENAQLEKLKQELADKKKREPKIKYMQLYVGLNSALDGYYAISDAGNVAWVYYEEFRRLGLMAVSKEAWEYCYELAANLKKKVETEDVYRKKMKLEFDMGNKTEQICQRFLFERFIESAFKNNYCIMTAYETANLEQFFKLEVPEPSEQFWEEYMITTVLNSYTAFKEGKNIRGMHAVVYNWLYKAGHLDKYLAAEEKEKCINQAQEEVYEIFSNYQSNAKPVMTTEILAKIRSDHKNCPQVKYDAKFKALQLFFTNITKANVNFKLLIDGKTETQSDRTGEQGSESKSEEGQSSSNAANV